jgi:hypothetical protein
MYDHIAGRWRQQLPQSLPLWFDGAQQKAGWATD